MNVHEALEWALDCLASDDEVIGEAQTYTLNGVEMARSTAYADSLAQAKAALSPASPRQGEPVALDVARLYEAMPGEDDEAWRPFWHRVDEPDGWVVSIYGHKLARHIAAEYARLSPHPAEPVAPDKEGNGDG